MLLMATIDSRFYDILNRFPRTFNNSRFYERKFVPPLFCCSCWRQFPILRKKICAPSFFVVSCCSDKQDQFPILRIRSPPILDPDNFSISTIHCSQIHSTRKMHSTTFPVLRNPFPPSFCSPPKFPAFTNQQAGWTIAVHRRCVF